MNIIELSEDFSTGKEGIMKLYHYPADYESVLKNMPIDEQLKHFYFLCEDEDRLHDVNDWSPVRGALVWDGIIYGFVVNAPDFCDSYEKKLYVNEKYAYYEQYEVDGGGYNTYNEKYAQLKFIP